jgi:hypothetical protein
MFPANTVLRSALLSLCISLLSSTHAQQVTGYWKGKISNKNVEIKIVQKGDSLTGTSYYYESATNYKRYSIRGYFDPSSNSVVWWDDQLIAGSTTGKNSLLSVADFNCPGGGAMTLDGKAVPREERGRAGGPVSLTKVSGPYFTDEWDFVIDNYTIGANDPDIIDSVSFISTTLNLNFNLNLSLSLNPLLP